jgi:2-C-methyl-D-erythritol 4-phosphate cytidylyltransferase
MNNYAIIVAGGKGERMKSEKPKQFLEIEGKTILEHTLARFLEIPAIQIILAIPEANFPEWNQIQNSKFPKENIITVTGGKTRSDSVRNGLKVIVGDGLVAIHDAVRPFVTAETINKTYESAKEFGSGVAAVALKDSIRKILDNGHSEARNREDYALVQTPQTFRVAEIKEAYEKAEGFFSDDATVYENAGFVVRLTEGEYSNIKITTPEDLK